MEIDALCVKANLTPDSTPINETYFIRDNTKTITVPEFAHSWEDSTVTNAEIT